MKTLSIIMSIVFAVAIGNAQEVVNSTTAFDSNKLLIRGVVENPEDNSEEKCKVELFYENTIKDSIYLSDDENVFEFNLKKDKTYAIRISKAGYVNRIIFIDSSVPMNIKSDEPYMFEFSTKLIRVAELAKAKKSENNIPRIVIYFDNKLKSFYFYKDRVLTANKDFPYPYKRFDFKI